MDHNSLLHLLRTQLSQVLHSDKHNIYYLLYYSFLEAVLLMISPLASAFIINSVLSHATISIPAKPRIMVKHIPQFYFGFGLRIIDMNRYFRQTQRSSIKSNRQTY